jgi:hypothetical protein
MFLAVIVLIVFVATLVGGAIRMVSKPHLAAYLCPIQVVAERQGVSAILTALAARQGDPVAASGIALGLTIDDIKAVMYAADNTHMPKQAAVRSALLSACRLDGADPPTRSWEIARVITHEIHLRSRPRDAGRS